MAACHRLTVLGGAGASAMALVLVTACTPSAPPVPPYVPDPSTTTGSGRAWPGPGSTGVPDGTRLRPWTDDCTVTRRGMRIDARLVECDLRIRAEDVVITRSRILGTVVVPQPDDGGSFLLSDSEVDVGDRLVTAVGNASFTLRRVEVTGGRRSVNCEADCTVEGSWVHGQTQDPSGEAHLSGIRMGRGTTLLHNTIVCDGERSRQGSGCSAALTGYGDFAPVEDNVVQGNLFRSGTASFCAFGGSTRDKPFSEDANHVRFVDNVFDRGESGSCGIHGAIEAFDVDAPGNVWRDNVYDDGEPVPPRN